jgi:hypothetical protein
MFKEEFVNVIVNSLNNVYTIQEDAQNKLIDMGLNNDITVFLEDGMIKIHFPNSFSSKNISIVMNYLKEKYAKKDN